MNRKETLDLLTRHTIRPTRSLGQNFLVDERVAVGICDIAGVEPTDLVIEIGPGVGNLTVQLVRKAGAVIALEIDCHVLPALREVLEGCSNCTILHTDALKADLTALAASWPGPVKVVANLPYYITTPLIVKMLVELPACSGLILMVQKEAAARIMARPCSRQYGPMAILAACFGETRRELNVPADAFFPRPGVESSVVRVIPAAQPPAIRNWPEFYKFLEQCFAQRRRTLVNSLRIAGLKQTQTNILPSIMANMEIASDVRAEALTCVQFVELFKNLVVDIS